MAHTITQTDDIRKAETDAMTTAAFNTVIEQCAKHYDAQQWRRFRPVRNGRGYDVFVFGGPFNADTVTIELHQDATRFHLFGGLDWYFAPMTWRELMAEVKAG